MSQFSVNASHELRTPLTTARGQLEVALLSARTVEEYREAIGVAVQETRAAVATGPLAAAVGPGRV